MAQNSPEKIDWNLTTWEGSRREQTRRWAELSWDEIIAAQEEMAELAKLAQIPFRQPSPKV